MVERYFFVFNSRNQAVYMEELLRERGYSVELRPTPSKIAKSCNTSLVVHGRPEEIDNIRDQIQKCKMSVRGIYKEIKTGYFMSYAKVY
ncbi:MAG: DUF3343 domain-containing protein [Clostridiales bacterium]|nr:DUF3343 domain-containing protein [Clostridiales bacterium]